MEPDAIIKQAERIAEDANQSNQVLSALAEAREITRTFGGEKSSFYRALEEVNQTKWNDEYIGRHVRQTLDAFIKHIKHGLMTTVSIERQARIDVVSDILDQAQMLLENGEVHPAAAAVLVGAVLEEFLRNWTEDNDLQIGNRKPGIDSYTGLLREADLITKQDTKDLTSWAGIRNHAAHGDWTEVEDRTRIRIMLEGVNLFMRRYSK